MNHTALAGLRREDDREHGDGERAEEEDQLRATHGCRQASRMTSSSTMPTSSSTRSASPSTAVMDAAAWDRGAG